MTIKTNIKIIRKLCKLTQENFAVKVGVSLAIQKNYETLRSPVEDIYVKRLSEIFEIPENDLMNIPLTEEYLKGKVQKAQERDFKPPQNRDIIPADNQDIRKLNLTVSALNKTIQELFAIHEGLKEFVARRVAAKDKISHAEALAEMGILEEDIRKKVHSDGIPIG